MKSEAYLPHRNAELFRRVNKGNEIMSHYHKEEMKAVMPMYGVENYTVKIQIRTENGATKWITVPADKVEQLKSLVEGF